MVITTKREIDGLNVDGGCISLNGVGDIRKYRSRTVRVCKVGPGSLVWPLGLHRPLSAYLTPARILVANSYADVCHLTIPVHELDDQPKVIP